MYLIKKYICILYHIQVFDENALTPDNEETKQFTLIYERIQAIRTYTCKQKKGAKNMYHILTYTSIYELYVHFVETQF
jgi:hypothetical protein